MPIYEYNCEHCKKKFELLRPLALSNDPAPCPTCEKPADRIISACSSKIKEGSVIRPTSGTSACSGCNSKNCGSCIYSD